MIADIGLGLAVVSAGPVVGPAADPHHDPASRSTPPKDGAGFTAQLRRFLPVARRSPTNDVLVARPRDRPRCSP